MSTLLRFKPARRVALFVANTVVVNWAWKNRSRLIDRVRPSHSADPKTDTSRPIGDRVVPRVAGRAANPYEAAMER